MLREHEPAAADDGSAGFGDRSPSWATPDQGRRGTAWWLARTVAERRFAPTPVAAGVGRI